jgi:hypothetical protein
MIIITGRYGRLGNRLWTYANVLAFALEHSIEVINPAFDDFANSFSSNTLAFCGKDEFSRRQRYAYTLAKLGGWDLLYKLNLRLRRFPTIELGEGHCLDLDIDDTAETRFRAYSIVFLSGLYFIAAKSLISRAGEIRSAFYPRPHIMVRVQKRVQEARQLGDVLVGVHLRQGDYRVFCDGVMFYTTKEYVDVMRGLRDQRPDKRVIFMVCSDEEQDHDLFNGLNVLFGSGDAVVDLYTLAHCDYIVGPNSTFSQWASFWGNVPLHVLDWRAALTYGKYKPVLCPVFERDFVTFEPNKFGQYSRGRLCLADVLPARGALPLTETASL